jgi:hypothetical protein
VTIFEICADDSGNSYWNRHVAKFDTVDYAPPLPPLLVSEKFGASGYILIRVPSDLDKVPHPTPNRQLCVVLGGAIEITTSNGESKKFDAGESFVMADTTGLGHVAQNVGDGEGLVMMVHLE